MSMESHIDDALAAMTIVFDVDRYSLVMSAYQMLDKLKVKSYIKILMGVYFKNAAMKLQKFFRVTITSSARSMVLEILRPYSDNLEAEIDALSYEELCAVNFMKNF